MKKPQLSTDNLITLAVAAASRMMQNPRCYCEESLDDSCFTCKMESALQEAEKIIDVKMRRPAIVKNSATEGT